MPCPASRRCARRHIASRMPPTQHVPEVGLHPLRKPGDPGIVLVRALGVAGGCPAWCRRGRFLARRHRCCQVQFSEWPTMPGRRLGLEEGSRMGRRRARHLGARSRALQRPSRRLLRMRRGRCMGSRRRIGVERSGGKTLRPIAGGRRLGQSPSLPEPERNASRTESNATPPRTQPITSVGGAPRRTACHTIRLAACARCWPDSFAKCRWSRATASSSTASCLQKAKRA